MLGYNDVLKNFSSTICELRADVAEEWQEVFINEAITANIDRIARWDRNLNEIRKISLLSSIPSTNGLYVKDNEDFIIDNNPEFTSPELTSGENAAKTFIIIGKNLIINKNITYGPTDYNSPSTIPSVAFIVIDGNIEIAENVTELNGIYMALDTNNDGIDGQINQIDIDGDEIDMGEQLTIYGNLFGDVNNLFSSRTYVGDPMKDQGSVTIHYDERILLNTPPGISELVDIQQAIVPN